MFTTGLLKIAALKLLTPPKMSMATKSMAKSVPSRVTTDLQPLNAVNGIGGITGTKEIAAPFSNAGFAHGHRKALVPRSQVKPGRFR